MVSTAKQREYEARRHEKRKASGEASDKAKKQTNNDRVKKIHEELKKQEYSGDFDVITPVILAEVANYVGNEKQKRLGKVVRARIVKECIEREKRPNGATAAGAANASPPMPSTTRAAFETNNDDDDDDDDAAHPESESEIDPHAGLTSPRGVDADVSAIGSSSSNVKEDSKIPADQVASSASASFTNDDSKDDDEEHNDDAAAESPSPASLPPPSFYEDHLQIIAEAIHQTKVAQVDVGNVGRANGSGSLLFLPPKSWSFNHDMHPLINAKIVLRTRFEGISDDAVGGTERIRALGDVHCSSMLYNTLILSTKDDKGTSVVLWKSIEEGRSWFISWLAVNAKCERKGYSKCLLQCVNDLAKGFGLNGIYLEVGKSSIIRDDGEWDGVKAFYAKLGFIDAGDDIPDEVKACCQELAKGTH